MHGQQTQCISQPKAVLVVTKPLMMTRMPLKTSRKNFLKYFAEIIN